MESRMGVPFVKIGGALLLFLIVIATPLNLFIASAEDEGNGEDNSSDTRMQNVTSALYMVLDRIENRILLLKDKGYNTSSLEDMVVLAREKIDSGEIQEAKQLIREIIKELVQLVAQNRFENALAIRLENRIVALQERVAGDESLSEEEKTVIMGMLDEALDELQAGNVRAAAKILGEAFAYYNKLHVRERILQNFRERLHEFRGKHNNTMRHPIIVNKEFIGKTIHVYQASRSLVNHVGMLLDSMYWGNDTLKSIFYDLTEDLENIVEGYDSMFVELSKGEMGVHEALSLIDSYEQVVENVRVTLNNTVVDVPYHRIKHQLAVASRMIMFELEFGKKFLTWMSNASKVTVRGVVVDVADNQVVVWGRPFVVRELELGVRGIVLVPTPIPITWIVTYDNNTVIRGELKVGMPVVVLAETINSTDIINDLKALKICVHMPIPEEQTNTSVEIA